MEAGFASRQRMESDAPMLSTQVNIGTSGKQKVVNNPDSELPVTGINSKALGFEGQLGEEFDKDMSRIKTHRLRQFSQAPRNPPASSSHY